MSPQSSLPAHKPKLTLAVHSLYSFRFDVALICNAVRKPRWPQLAYLTAKLSCVTSLTLILIMLQLSGRTNCTGVVSR